MRNSIGVRIPAGAPKNILRLSAGDIFFGRSRGVEVYPRQGKSPLEHQKISLAFRGGNIFSGCSRGVEVYPRQGKSPLEHQKISSPFGGGYFFPVAPGESKFIPVRGNPRWSTKNLQASQYACRFLLFRSSLFTIHFTVKCAGAWPSFISPLRMIAAIRLCVHIIIIYNDIHARTEPAGILQKIRV